MIVRAVQTLVGLFCATALFWLGILFEHRPAGWPNIVAPWSILGWHPVLRLPDGPVAKLDAILAAEMAAQTRAMVIAAQQTAITQTAATHDAKAQAAIKVVYRNLIQKVPVYVTAQADSRCVVPLGYIRLFNAAASGVDLPAVPGTAPGANDAPSGVPLDTVASVTVSALGTGNAIRQQLIDAQAWIRDEQAASGAQPRK